MKKKIKIKIIKWHVFKTLIKKIFSKIKIKCIIINYIVFQKKKK